MERNPLRISHSVEKNPTDICNKFPRKGVMAPSLSELKEHLDLVRWFGLRLSPEEQGVGLENPYQFLLTFLEDIFITLSKTFN